MRINIITPAFLLGAAALFLQSCTANALPKVKNASYQSYNISGEKGYYATFELSEDSFPATAVVINRIQQNISASHKTGLKYNVNVISQSRKIFGFKPKVTDRENGIFFKTDTAEVFKPVNFKLQK